MATDPRILLESVNDHPCLICKGVKWSQAWRADPISRSSIAGLPGDPGQVIRLPAGDGPRRDARHLVRVLFLGSGDDLRYPAACHLAVCQGGPAVRCPFRPARPPGRRPGDLIAIQLGSVRCLELFTPSVDVDLGHEVGLVRCG